MMDFALRSLSFQWPALPCASSLLTACIAITHLCCTPADASGAEPRLRLIVETDAGGDPDDEQSLVRFLLYANEWDVLGIIANRPQARDGENRNTERTGVDIVRRLVRAYGEVWPSLHAHDPRYPSPEEMLRRVVPGYADTDDGVQLILRAVDDDDPRPVWFSNWGTDRGSAPSCLLRALDRVLQERGDRGYARFKSRLRLSSTDNFGRHTAEVAPPFPLWINPMAPELEGKRWYHRFSALTAKAGGFDLERDVRTGHGPLGALYPTNTTHPQKEGDTMTFLYLLPTGMNDPEQPTWGCWAGRHGPQEKHPGRPYFHANQQDTLDGVTSRDNTLARWAVDLQNDFRARMDWCVKRPAEANHPPLVTVAGERLMRVKPGAAVDLDARASRDPDGQPLTFEWWLYPECSTPGTQVEIRNASQPLAQVIAPAAPATLHLLVTVRDNGSPPLARYGRVVLTVAP
jgi:hypothetical protein